MLFTKSLGAAAIRLPSQTAARTTAATKIIVPKPRFERDVYKNATYRTAKSLFAFTIGMGTLALWPSVWS